MNIVSSLALVVTVGWISGCTTTAERHVVNIPLAATQYNAGHIAQATMVPMGNDTSVSIIVAGVPGWTSLPARIHTYIYSGTCQNLGPKPAYEMNRIVTTDYMTPLFQLSKVAPVTLNELRSGDYALVLRASPADGNMDLFCGDIT